MGIKHGSGGFVRMGILFCVLLVSACAGGSGAGPGTAGLAAEDDYSVSDCDCNPLSDVVGETITVATAEELAAAVSTVNSTGGNRTVLLEDGHYFLTNMIYIVEDHVMFRSVSGNRNSVVLEGQGMDGGVPHVFLVAASDVTIADLSLGEVAYHGIQVQGEQGANNLRVHNVRIFNTHEQMIKGSFGNESGSDDGVVECSLFEYTALFGPQYYIGGIDVHRGKDWVVRRNVFKNIRSPGDRIAEHAIHFWNRSEYPLIERNIIINCDRGIGLGLNDSACIGGMIRNNTIYGDDQGLYSDVGIGLETADHVRVYNNTIIFDHSYPNAIEYRFAASTGIDIVNNLTNKAIADRNGGSATVRNNVTTAESSWFEDAASGDLHLASDVDVVVDAGETLDAVAVDLDGEGRPQGGGADIGADEYTP